MRYEYSGYLKTFMDAPDPKRWDSLDSVEFTAEDLAAWELVDDDADKEWQHIPAGVERRGDTVQLWGHFEEVRRIDNLDHDDPSFWVPLSSMKIDDARFPIDVTKYPIVEMTYRCVTPMARPAWQWHYPGGVCFDGLKPSRTWRTIVRSVCHSGFPERVDAVTFRLYATERNRETLELRSLRFRAPSPEEAKACRKHETTLSKMPAPKHYPVLDDFMPVGVCMKAGSAKRLAKTMDISFDDYWRLTFEDVARHNHNTIALEELDQLTKNEWKKVLGLADTFSIRLVGMYDWPMDTFNKRTRGLIDRHIVPHKDRSTILGWRLRSEPPEHTFQAHLEARRYMEEAVPGQPLVALMRSPNSFPRFAPHFAASGMAHFQSGVSRQLGELVRTHLRLSRGQQFWVVAPAFVYATETPEWNTCPEMRLMLNLALANGARGWFTFAYHNDPIWLDGHCQRSLTGPFLTFSDLWAELGNRMERFQVLAPLFLGASPTAALKRKVSITYKRHPQGKCPKKVPAIECYWLRGEDYTLLYVVSQDIGQVTPVYFKVAKRLPGRQEIYDMTDFVRSRQWTPMERQRHLEMFPGQGQVLLIAAPEVCERWRGVCAQRILEADRRCMGIDLGLARRYNLDLTETEATLDENATGDGPEELAAMLRHREQLVNTIYAAPNLVEPRSKIIQASAAICGCDGALCRLLGAGKVDLAHEKGLHVLPLAREMAQLRLHLRAGRGVEILPECTDLAQRTLSLLTEIRNLS